MFEGYLLKQPEYSENTTPSGKILHVIHIILKQPPDTYIQCIGIGSLAIRLKALDLKQDDKVYIQATFKPYTTSEKKYVLRFVIDKLIVMEKKTSPIPLQYEADNNTYDLLEYIT